MVLSPNSFEYRLFFILTVIVLITKAVLSIFLAKKILDKKKREGSMKFDFIFSVFILMVGLFISRLLYTYFDFFLTQFDNDLYWRMPNVLVWKLGGLAAGIGFIFVLFIIDKKVLKFKLKGSLAIIYAIAMSIQFLYPVNSLEDFQFISTIGFYFNFIALIIPVIFFYIGIKIPGLRRTSFLIAFAVIIYGIGGSLASESLIAPFATIFGPDIRIIFFLLFLVFKLVGLSLLTQNVTKFNI